MAKYNQTEEKEPVDPTKPYEGELVEDAGEGARLVSHRDPVTGGMAVTDLDTGVTQTTATAQPLRTVDISLHQFLDSELKANRNQFLMTAHRSGSDIVAFTIRSKNMDGPALDFEIGSAGNISSTTLA